MRYPRFSSWFPALLLGVTLMAAVPALAQRGDDPERESRAFDRFAEGQILEEQGNFTGALKVYEAAASVLDTSPTLFLAMARCAFYLPDYKKARRYAERAAELGPEEPEPHFLLGSAAYRLGDVEGAVTAMRTASSLDSLNVHYAETLGSVLEAENRPREAIEVFEGVRRNFPYISHILTRLGRLYLRVNDPDTAIERFETAAEEDPGTLGLMSQLGAAYDLIGDTDRAVEAYRQAIEQNPNDLTTRRRLVDALVVSGRLSEGLREVKTLRYMNPDDTDVVRRLSTIAYGVGDFEEALSALAFLDERDAMTADLHTMRAEIHARMGNDALAAESAERALEDGGPATVRAQLFLARMAMRAGDLEGAEDRLQGALERDPENPDLRFALALLYTDSGRFEEALPHLDALEETAPGNVEIGFARGMALERSGRFDEAVDVFEVILQDAPRHHRSLNYLSYMYAERGEKLDEAKELVERALEIEPRNPAYLDTMGWVLFQMGRPRESERFLAEAAALSPDPVVHEHLGDVYVELDRPGDAVGAYQAALDGGADPDRLTPKLARARDQVRDSTEPDGS